MTNASKPPRSYPHNDWDLSDSNTYNERVKEVDVVKPMPGTFPWRVLIIPAIIFASIYFLLR